MTEIIFGIEIPAINGAGDDLLTRVDFGAPVAVSAVDVFGAELSGNPVSDCLRLAYSNDGVVWTNLGLATLGGGVRSRRFVAPSGAPISARYWAATLQGIAALAGRSLKIYGIQWRVETATLSAARILPHLVSDEKAYSHVLTDFTDDIYSGGVRVGFAPSPYPGGVLLNIDYTSDDDLLMTFHENVRPNRFFRQGADDEWDSRPQYFTNIPNYEFGDTVYTNGVNEKQQVEFNGFVAGETFNLTFDGETTSTIVYAGAGATTAANIKNALEAMGALGGGTVDVIHTGADVYSIEYQGAAGQWDWSEIAGAVINSAAGFVTTATLIDGRQGGEAIASDARGWWRTADFDNERLVLGGPKSAKKILNASVFGDYFNLDAPGRRATDGVMLSVASNIRQLSAENFLQVFTDARAMSLRAPALLGDDINPIKPDGDHGIQDRMRPVSTDDATYIVQNGGRALIELRYSDEAQGYIGENVSVRAPDLVHQPLDIFARRAGFGFECNAIFLCNRSGDIALYQSLRSVNFRPWARYSTPSGKFLCGGAEERGPTMVVVERVINEQTVRYVEGFDINRLLDCSIKVTVGDGGAATLACAHLEGQEVWAIGSTGYWYGPAKVQAGVIRRPDGLPFDAGTYEVGLLFPAEVTPMPIRFDTQGGSIADNPKRVASCTVSVQQSSPPELVYMGKAYDFPGMKHPTPILDAPPMNNLLTTRLERDRLRGWSNDPVLTIRRKWPGPFYVRSVDMTVLWTN